MITLKTLPQATAQEVFDQVATHLLKQNKKAIRESDGSCMYRTSSGLKCAAGCLIGDDEYTYEFEWQSWGDLATERIVTDSHFDLIFGLQRIHDNSKPSDWCARLEILAQELGLTMPKDLTQ